MTSHSPPDGVRGRHLVFLCSPSLGILDNWLPVLHAARTRHPDWRFVAVIPSNRTVFDIVEDDTVVAIAEGVFDEVVFRSVAGDLRRAGGLVDARGLASRERAARFVLRVGRAVESRLRLRGMSGLASALARRLLPGGRSRRVEPAWFAGLDAVACYDVYVRDKPDCDEVLAQLVHAPRFSLHHGVNVLEPDPASAHDGPPPTRAYLYAERERDAYRVNFNVPADRLAVVGVPRHERSWTAQVVEASAAAHDVAWDDEVFLISRPGGTTYLPYERRLEALRDIHQVVCEERGLRLVVKLHPKERDRGDFDRAFPAGSEGRTWMRSRAHPSHLGSRSRFAISFLSGVAIDMVALGVATIERLDVRGLPEHDNPGAPRDAAGRPAYSFFRRHGLVLPADDIDDLRAQVDRILADRDGVVAELRAAYDEIFADPSGAIDTIVADLSSA